MSPRSSRTAPAPAPGSAPKLWRVPRPTAKPVLLTNPAFLINPHIKKVTYDPLTDFDPVCNIVNFPLVFVVPKIRH